MGLQMEKKVVQRASDMNHLFTQSMTCSDKGENRTLITCTRYGTRASRVPLATRFILLFGTVSTVYPFAARDNAEVIS